MNDQSAIQINDLSFKDFIVKTKPNRLIFSLIAVDIIIQLILFKYFYPFPTFIHDDSFKYIESAMLNLDVNFYLIGYSKFLQLVGIFTRSALLLVIIQYLLVQASILFLLYTIFYFYKPNKKVQLILITIMVLNPLLLYMANMISSDCWFLSLSFIWFTLLLWLIHKPNNSIIVLITLVSFIAFTVRYNALIYPLISLIAFGLSPVSVVKKVLGFASILLLCGLFVYNTGNKYKALTGEWQFAPFSGWQLANNAMYAYRYVDSADRKPVPERFKALDNNIRMYFDSTRNTMKFPIELLQASTFYMWHRGLPLFKYRDTQFSKDTVSSDLKKWAMMGPLYKDYGLFIMKQYPTHFLKYFIWPNTSKYFATPVEYLENYNDGKDFVKPVAKDWFRLSDTKVTTRTKDKKIELLNFFPILTGIMNGVFLFALLSFIILNGFRYNSPFRYGILLAGIFWLINACFSIVSTAAALRFLAFPIINMTIFAILIIAWISREAVAIELKKQNAKSPNNSMNVSTEILAYRDQLS